MFVYGVDAYQISKSVNATNALLTTRDVEVSL